MKKIGATWVFALKAAIGVALLAILFWTLDTAQFARTLSSVRPAFIVAALAAYMAGKILTAVRWVVLARPLGFHQPTREFVAFYYIGMFFNLFAPSTLGGDAGKVFYVSRDYPAERRADAATRALISILADRAIGMAVLVWIGAGALIAFPADAALVPAPVRYATFVIALVPLVAYGLFPFFGRALEKIPHSLGKKLMHLGNAYWKRPDVLAESIVLSFVFHVIQIWIQVLIASALGFHLPWSYALVFFPLVDIVAMLPVSISGIGLREGSYVFFLGKLGIGADKAIACGIVWLAIVIASGLVGGLIFILYGRRAQSESP
jgi:glycosyltransferase 2 family protein